MAPAAWLAVLASLRYVHAARTGHEPDIDDNSPDADGCELAVPIGTSPWQFQMSYTASTAVTNFDVFHLRRNADCSGPSVAGVSVTHYVDALEPLTRSRAIVTLEPNYFTKRLYVCNAPTPVSSARCWASIQPTRRPFQPHHVLLWLPGLSKSKALHQLDLGERHGLVTSLEWVLILLALVFMGATAHAIWTIKQHLDLVDLFRSASQADDASNAATRSTGQFAHEPAESQKPPIPKPIDYSSPFWEFVDIVMISSSAMVASVSVLQVVLVIVRNSGHPAAVILCVCWPSYFGTFMLWRFWLSSCRLQLYSAALGRGICIRGNSPWSLGSVLQFMSFGVLLLCVLSAFWTLWNVNPAAMAKSIQLSPYVVNPLTSLASSLSYMFFRTIAQNKTQCPAAIDELMKLQGLSCPVDGPQGEGEPTGSQPDGGRLARMMHAGVVPIVSEGTFCQVCREGRDPVAVIKGNETLEEGQSFGLRDLPWHGPMIYSLSGSPVAMLNLPVAICGAITLTAASTAFAISCLTMRPVLHRISTSANSLGFLVPHLSSWQTSYDFMLDYTQWSFAVWIKADPRNTDMMHFNLPDGTSFETYDESILATIHLEGTTFPANMQIVATGSRRMSTAYNISVVKEHRLVTLMKLWSGNYSRCMSFSETSGTVMSVPEHITDLHVQLIYEYFHMGTPLSVSDAEDEMRGDALRTVFHPMNSSRARCEAFCEKRRHCLLATRGVTGCFFVFRPAVRGQHLCDLRMEVKPEKEHSAINHGILKGWLCAYSQGSIEDCASLRRQGNTLSTRVELPLSHAGTFQAQLQLANAFEGREVLDNTQKKPKLTFGHGVPLPQGALSYFSAADTSVEFWSESRIVVRLGAYDAASLSHYNYVTLYVAILLPDLGFSVKSFSLDGDRANQAPSFNCKGVLFDQFDVCGGWRPSSVMAVSFPPFMPWKQLDLRVVPDQPRSGFEEKAVTLKVETAQDMEPAEWLVQKGCKLDLTQLPRREAHDILTLRVYKTIARVCTRVTVLFSDSTWEPDLLQLMQYALVYFDTVQVVVELAASVEQNPGVRNIQSFLRNVGFTRCSNRQQCCVNLPGNWSKTMTLPLVRIIEQNECTGTFANIVCELTDASDIQCPTLNTAVQYGDLNLVGNLTACIKRKRMQRFTKDACTARKFPAITAIENRRPDLLDLVLGVSDICAKMDLDDSGSRFSTLVELAVAYGCAECAQVLRRHGLSTTRLSFTPYSSTSHWDTLAPAVLARLPDLERVSFDGSGSSLPVIIGAMLPLAQAGKLAKLKYLNLHYKRSELSGWHNDATAPPRLCDMLKALTGLKGLYLGSLTGSLEETAPVLEALIGLEHLEELNIDVQSFYDYSSHEQPNNIKVAWQASMMLKKLSKLQLILYRGSSNNSSNGHAEFVQQLESRLSHIHFSDDVEGHLQVLFRHPKCSRVTQAVREAGFFGQMGALSRNLSKAAL